MLNPLSYEGVSIVQLRELLGDLGSGTVPCGIPERYLEAELG